MFWKRSCYQLCNGHNQFWAKLLEAAVSESILPIWELVICNHPGNNHYYLEQNDVTTIP
jgi:hypothetical protein